MLKRLPMNDNTGMCFVVHKSSNFYGNSVSKISNFMRKGCLEDHLTFWKHLSL